MTDLSSNMSIINIKCKWPKYTNLKRLRRKGRGLRLACFKKHAPTRAAKIKTVTAPDAGKGAEKPYRPCTAGGNIQGYSHSGKTVRQFL